MRRAARARGLRGCGVHLLAAAVSGWAAGSAAAAQARTVPPLGLASPAPSRRPAGLDEARLEALANAAAAGMARLGAPGLALALGHAAQPELVWTRPFGFADIENDVPVVPETMFRLASLSKPLTAVAVMQLAEQGRLELDAPVRRYVPAFPEKPWPVSARQLLAHQGGVRHVADDEWGSTRRYLSVGAALEVFKDDPLLFEPGTRTHYSTYGYNLLGAAVEGAAGLPYLAYLRDHISGPAGLESLRDDDAAALVRHRAQGYRRDERGELRNSIPADTSNKLPGGGLSATAADVARFGAALLAGRLLQPATLADMARPQKLRSGRLTEYTLGFRTTRWHGRRELWHHGGQPRVSNLIYMLPDDGLVLVLLTNLEGITQELLALARSLGELALDPTVMRPRPTR